MISSDAVTRYLYLLELSRELGPEQVEELRQELGQLFQSSDVIVEQGKQVKLHSALAPDGNVDSGLQKLTGKFGPIVLRAGS